MLYDQMTQGLPSAASSDARRMGCLALYDQMLGTWVV